MNDEMKKWIDPKPSKEMLFLTGVSSACALDGYGGDVMGYFQIGHWSPWSLREEVGREEMNFGPDDRWPRREWWRAVPYSLQHPDEPPCGDGPESILLVKCKRTDGGAFPVTVLYVEAA